MIRMDWIIIYIVIIDLLLISVSCDKCTETVTVGSLSHGNTIGEDKTYILAGYEIPSQATVVAWEFCYRTSDATSVTFYPGIWRITDRNDYELVKSNNITYDPSNTSNPFSCSTIDLSLKDQIAVSAGSVVGLYSNTGSLLLRSNPDDSVATYECDGNQSNARPNKKENVNYNITIKAHLNLVNSTGDEVFVGSLNYDLSTVDEDDTYILATNTIPCNGTVVAWEFCYQISNDTSATFYPGIWWITRSRGTSSNDYALVQSSNVTFDPRGTSCQVFTLTDADQFIAPKGSFIGLYTGNTQLLRFDNMNTSITTFQLMGNKSSVDNLWPNNKEQDVNYNIAVRVHLVGFTTVSLSSTTSSTTTSSSVMTTAAAVSTEIVPVAFPINTSMYATAASVTVVPSVTLPAVSGGGISFRSPASASGSTITPSPIVTSDQHITSGHDDGSSSVAGVVAGCIVAIVVCIAIVASIILLLWYQRRRKDKNTQDAVSYVNCKSKSLKYPMDDYQFSDHQYSVVRYEVVHEPEINGMVTIKDVTAVDYETVSNPSCYFDVDKINGDLNERPSETTPYMEPSSTIYRDNPDSPDYYASVCYDNGEVTCYVDSTGSIVKDHRRNDYEAVPVLSMYEEADDVTPYHYEVDTGSIFRNSITEDSTMNEMLPDTEQIYQDPGYNKEEIYSWFEEKKFRKIKRSNIEISQKLGSGEFGTVHLGLWSNGSTDPAQVAVKTLNSQCSESDRVKFLREAAIMGQFVHNNVVQLHGVVTEEENMMIVLEYMPKGDLREFLIKKSTPIGEGSELKHDLLTFCRQIAAGMNHLASKQFVHRDLAARNILVSSDDVCKIADFGMARDVTDDIYYITGGGKIPVKWTPPEAIFYKKYSAKSDVWSFGCVMYEVWSLGHKPFEGFNGKEYVHKIKSGYRLPPPPGCPRAVYELMIQCWHPTTKGRPTSGSISLTLQKSDSALLPSSVQVTDDNVTSESQSMILGAPLTAGSQLYLDLQQSYVLK